MTSRSIYRVALLLGSAAIALFTLPALAEKADRDKPVNLEADRMSTDDAKKINTFEGHVVLTQGTLTIRADKVLIQQDQNGFQHGTAYGNPASFRVKQDKKDGYIDGYAERIEYDASADKAEFFNKAHLKRGSDEVRGNYIAYDGKTEFYKVTGGGTGTPENPEGRVRAIIQTKKKTEVISTEPPPPNQTVTTTSGTDKK